MRFRDSSWFDPQVAKTLSNQAGRCKDWREVKLKISAFDNFSDQLEIDLQNENLIIRQEDRIPCTVPDLIGIISLEDGELTDTELLSMVYRWHRTH